MSWLKRPWLHFLLLGSALFLLQGWLFPPPAPALGPLPPARVEALEREWLMATGRPPDDAQRERMIRAELDRELLFRQGLALELQRYDGVIRQRLLRNMQFLDLGGEEQSDAELIEQALEMRLHLGDEVVKRRMIQVVEQLLLAANPPAAPDPAAIESEFERRREELRRPPRYSIQHLYFPRERAEDIGAAMAAIEAQGLGPEQALEFSSPFLPGFRFDSRTPDQLARQFGSAFVLNLQRAGPEPGRWCGPIESTYGLHYVWVEAIEPGRDATLDEVSAQLRRDLESRARAEALAQATARLRENYEVVL